jgi:hypothetical protein
MNPTNFFTTIKASTKQHWWDTILWFLFTVLVSLLPVWGSCIIFGLFSLPIKFETFISGGEFAIYSAALLAPVLYTILKELGAPFRPRTIVGLLAIVFLMVSAILFAGVTAGTRTSEGSSPIKINIAFLATVSVILFILSAILTFFVKLIDTIAAAPDIYDMRTKETETLSKRFDETETQD